MKFWRIGIIGLGLIAVWQAVVWLTGAPHFILPDPLRVLWAGIEHWPTLLKDARITLIEIVAGLALGTLLGCASAVAIAWFRPVRAWLMPVLVMSQAIPVFALAPILVLWLGYGMASKVAMATLIIYFPVTSAFFDGLRRTEPGWLDLAHTMGASRLSILLHIRIPAALPALMSGLRVATAVAPIGAVVGEWVGSAGGLGRLMLHTSGRMQIDLMFAALAVLAVIAVTLYLLVDRAARWATPWQADDARADR